MRANGPVLFASISCHFYLECAGAVVVVAVIVVVGIVSMVVEAVDEAVGAEDEDKLELV